jgi:hypothetical protein
MRPSLGRRGDRTGGAAVGIAGSSPVVISMCCPRTDRSDPRVRNDPNRVASLVRTWIEGCQDAGALACAKHFPGHGRTTVDSHIALPVVSATAGTLRESDLLSFAIAVESGVASVMTAHVAYPALDPSGRPATLSAPILELARSELGFEGLLVSDALIMEGSWGSAESDAAVEAIQAGVDCCHPNDARRCAMRSAGDDERGLASPGWRHRSPATSARSRPPRADAGHRGRSSRPTLADALLGRGCCAAPPQIDGPLDSSSWTTTSAAVSRPERLDPHGARRGARRALRGRLPRRARLR